MVIQLHLLGKREQPFIKVAKRQISCSFPPLCVFLSVISAGQGLLSASECNEHYANERFICATFTESAKVVLFWDRWTLWKKPLNMAQNYRRAYFSI